MDNQDKKTILKMMTYGTYIVSSMYKDQYCASVITWATQASFDPPLISVCIKKDSITYDVISKSKQFILHILSSNQKDYAAGFFKTTEHINGKLNGQQYYLTVSGLPVLQKPPCYLECKVKDIIEIGDHPLFLSEIVDAKLSQDADPLELRRTGWSYGG